MARPTEFIPEEKVIDAMNVFWSKGYTASSLTDLTSAMTINKSSFYNTFGDKFTLFKDCLKSYLELSLQEYVIAAKEGDTPSEKLDKIIDMIVKVTIERENACFSVKSSFELAATDEDIKHMIRSGHDQITGLIRSLIVEAQHHGSINTERDAELMAHFIFNSFAGLRQSFDIYRQVNLVKKMGQELKLFVRK